jgi:methionyl aminopeptidase
LAPVIKDSREIEIMRQAGRIAAEALYRVGEMVRPGISTLELDRAAERIIRGRGATCEFNGYHGFPANVCASLNEQVVHGIPSEDTILKEGDIIGIDVGARYQGYVGDNARTFAVGTISKECQDLLDATEACLTRAIEKIGPGVKVWEVSRAVQEQAELGGYGIVREYAGHGIGARMHEDPQVPNYVDGGPRGSSVTLRPGMVICVEPMLNMGTAEVRVLPDNWTVVTRDGKPSAHFEHMIAVTEDGSEILTWFSSGETAVG